MIQYQRLGDALVDKGLISAEAVKQALQTQFRSGLRLGEVLIGMGLIREADLTAVLAEQYGFEIVDLDVVKPQKEALALISPGFALAHLVLPLQVTATELRCAIADPLDLVATDSTAQSTQRRVSLALAGPTQLFNAIQSAYDLGEPPRELSADRPELTCVTTVVVAKARRGRDTQEDRRTLLELLAVDSPTARKRAA